jgi:F-type H+-transporting ATPase subunit a
MIKKLFELHVGGIDLSFTNSALFMLIATVLIMGLQVSILQRDTVVPSRLQALYEIAYEFVAGLLKESAGSEGKKFFPFIFSLFLFILMGNLLGMIPYSFTFTSHIIVTFALAILVFMVVTGVGFIRHGWRFFKFFYPEGVSPAVAPLVVPIEVIAYLIRPVTLSIRLFANMMAGHIVLKLFGGFTVAMGIFGVIPFVFVSALTAFELLIAVLQAYVFAVLSCIYLNDALHLH